MKKFLVCIFLIANGIYISSDLKRDNESVTSCEKNHMEFGIPLKILEDIFIQYEYISQDSGKKRIVHCLYCWVIVEKVLDSYEMVVWEKGKETPTSCRFRVNKNVIFQNDRLIPNRNPDKHFHCNKFDHSGRNCDELCRICEGIQDYLKRQDR